MVNKLRDEKHESGRKKTNNNCIYSPVQYVLTTQLRH